MTGTLPQLEDRILVLQDKVDSAFVKAGFKPDQSRDASGRWGSGGGSTSLPEGVVYHGTSSKALSRILRDGLRPANPRSAGANASLGDKKLQRMGTGYVFVTDDLNQARYIAAHTAEHRKAYPVVLKLQIPPAEFANKVSVDPSWSDALRIKGHIDPKYIVGVAGADLAEHTPFHPIKKVVASDKVLYVVVFDNTNVDQVDQACLKAGFDPNEARDEKGQWGGGGIVRQPASAQHRAWDTQLGKLPYKDSTGTQTAAGYMSDALAQSHAGEVFAAVADKTGKIIAAGHARVDTANPTEGEIVSLGSLKSGTGSKVLSDLEAQLRTKGVKTVVLQVNARNRSFYLRNGYTGSDVFLTKDLNALRKDFDPNEARDPKGRWTLGGSANTVMEHVRTAKGWITSTRIGAAVNLVAKNYSTTAKDALASTAASILTQYPHGSGQGTGPETEIVKDMLLNLGLTMKVSTSQARDHVIAVYQKLKDIGSAPMGKAATHPAAQYLDEVITALKGLKLEDKPKPSGGTATGSAKAPNPAAPSPKRLNKLEDRLLVLRDRVDTVRKDSSNKS